MYELSKVQVDFILDDVRRNGIETEELQLNLLDHICCVIENEMSPDKNFDEFYRSVLTRFFKKELREIQEETDLLLTFKHYYAMKKVMLRSGMFSAITFAIGALLKIMHWPGAAAMLVLAITAVSFVFLPIFFLVKTKEVKEKKDKFILGFGVFFGVLFCISTMFKIQHWPGAGFLWMLGLGVLFFLFLPLFFFSGIRNSETKLNTILSSIMILIAGGLLFTLTNTSNSENERNSAYLISNQELKKTISNVTLQNDHFYNSSPVSINAQNVLLKSKIDLIISKITKLRKDLTLYISNDKKITEEELVAHVVYTGKSTMYLFNDKLEPKPYLTEIKTSIEELKKYIDSVYGKDKSLLLNTSDREKYDKIEAESVSWEHAYFGFVPLDYIYKNFDQLVLNIRITEGNCIK